MQEKINISNIPNIPPDAVYILSELERNGFEGYIVGGCVRDHLLGTKPKDWDITTNALPGQIKAVFDGREKSHTVDTGIQHGTVTVVIDHVGYEVTTYRIDGEYKDSRHPESVIFTDRINDDLARRDFTMNAIAYNPEKGFVDPYGGIEDIKNSTICAVGVAAERFDEDALRIMRALRFAAQLSFNIEAATHKALSEKVPLLKNISAERMRDEFTKLIMTDNPHYVEELWSLGIMDIFMPQAKCGEDIFSRIDESIRSLPLRLALLLRYSDGIEDLQKMLKALTFDNETARMTDAVIKASAMPLGSDYEMRRLINRTGTEGALLVIEYHRLTGCFTDAEGKADGLPEQYQRIIGSGDCCSIKQLALNGSDLIAAGIPKGKLIGGLLDSALDIVLHDPAMNERDKLMNAVMKEFEEYNKDKR